MIAVAQLVRDRPGTVARTLRGFGVGPSDLGDGLSWGEARILLDEAAGDPGTALGAELAEWAYPASMVQLLTLASHARSEEALQAIAPWSPQLRRSPTATPEEIASAQADLEAGVVFPD